MKKIISISPPVSDLSKSMSEFSGVYLTDIEEGYQDKVEYFAQAILDIKPGIGYLDRAQSAAHELSDAIAGLKALRHAHDAVEQFKFDKGGETV